MRRLREMNKAGIYYGKNDIAVEEHPILNVRPLMRTIQHFITDFYANQPLLLLFYSFVCTYCLSSFLNNPFI